MSTQHDKEVLNTVFNPLLPLGQFVYEDELPDELREEKEVIEEETEATKEAKRLELEGVKEAEKGALDKALELFTKAINLVPNKASGYNNRAQTHRLLGNVAEAKLDLNNAINLSGGKGIALAQSLCQRGLINLKEGKEDSAKADFETASNLGSQFAKAQLVLMNPYAALCNKMLKKAMNNLKTGETGENSEGKF